ncbi:MAG: TIM barrel protein, partial [Candidatus Aerophobetes bacterium]|nr:TIM barrel protein [Candidatus Aerophobetes bacterium]
LDILGLLSKCDSCGRTGRSMADTHKPSELAFKFFAEFGEEKVEKAVEAVKGFEVEVPSWIFGVFGGGRFGEYSPPGAARNIFEKLDDASVIHKLTGATPRIATHILWDLSKNGYEGDFEVARKVKEEARQRGLNLGAINPTYFLHGSHRGSFSAEEKEARERYIKQTILGGKIAKELANGLLTLWFPDGSLYPGQIELRDAYKNLREALKKSYKDIPRDVRILIEYNVFEPGTYSTTIPDWGTAALLAKELGPNVGVLVDLGHHHYGTNVEQIVSMLINEGIPGGFHFNTRYAADDDLSVEPNPENARILYELVVGDVIFNSEPLKNWAYMIDQCSSRENRIHAILHSMDSLQQLLAKAFLVDQDLLKKYQKNDEIILANRAFNDALISADVRPIVVKARLDKGLSINPVEEYVKSGYQGKIESERG